MLEAIQIIMQDYENISSDLCHQDMLHLKMGMVAKF